MVTAGIGNPKQTDRINRSWRVLTFSSDVVVLQINEFVKRARQAKIHAYIIGQLKKEMPAMIGKVKAQQRLIDTLEEEFGKVRVTEYFTAVFF